MGSYMANYWKSHREVISFSIMAALLAYVGIAQSWALALGIFNLCIISSIMALGVNIQWGYAGLFNVGIMGFTALGGLSVVIVSQPPVIDAINAGGAGMLISIVLIILTIFIATYLHKKKFNKWLVISTVVFGYFAIRYFYSDATRAIEAVNTAKTGYLGGLGLPVVFSWVAGGFLAAGAAWLIGKISLGLRSDYLAIATLGISEIVLYVIKNEDWLARGVKNVTGLQRPVPYELKLQQSQWFQESVQWLHQSKLNLVDVTEQSRALSILVSESSVVFVKICYAGIFVSILIGMIVLANLALNSPWGRKVRAIRDNEVAASAMGKNIVKQHLQIFVIGSAIAGVAGALMVTYSGQFVPTSYQPLRFTFLIWVMVIVGGSGNNLGSVIGAFVIWFLWIESGPMGLWLAETVKELSGGSNSLSDFLYEKAHFLRLVLMGSVMLIVLRFSPGGIFPEKNKSM